MDLGSILLVLAVALVVGVYIARPFGGYRGAAVSEGDRKRSALEAERERVLAIILELDMDYTMGKIATEDYQAQRGEWVAQGASILKQIDAVAGETAPDSAAEGREISPEKDLEAELEVAVARLRKGGKETAAGYCAQCGQQLFVGDGFCSRCGQPVKPEASG
ncbi:MAG: zinc ribbon domain-containing protein [Anaerolineales bacterium]